MNVVGFTACYGGMVRNHLAAARLTEAAKKLGLLIRLEVHGTERTSDPLTLEELTQADLAIVASEREADESGRFDAVPTVMVSTSEVVSNPKRVLMRGIDLIENIHERIYREKKLFTASAGQAVAAYLAAAYGMSSFAQAMAFPAIQSVVRGVMNEGGAVLVKRYGLDCVDHARYVEKCLSRLANPWRSIPIAEAAAEPLRKLAGNERLVRPLVGAVEYKLPYDNLARGVAAALLYVGLEDEQSRTLQSLVEGQGMVAALKHVSNGVLGATEIIEIEKHWKTLKEQSKRI